MNYDSIKISILLCLIIGWGTSVTAQQDEEEQITEEIITIGDWKPTLSDAIKIESAPSPYDSSLSIPELRYQKIPRQIKTEFQVEPIKAARLRIREPLDKLYQSYAKVGIGNYITPMAEFHYSSDRSRDHLYSAHLKHLSSKGGVRDHKEHSGFSDNEIKLRGKWFLQTHSVEADLSYKRNVVHHYGFSPELDTIDRLEEDEIEQRFNDIAGKIHLASYYKDKERFNHRLTASYYNFRDRYGAMENNAEISGQLRRYFDGELFKLNGEVDFDQYKRNAVGTEDSTLTNNRTIIKLNPQIDSEGKNYKVSVGLGVHTKVTHTGFFHFYPNAFAKYSLFDDIFIPYLGLTGNLKDNTFKSMSRANPFIRSDFDLRTSNEKYEVYGGIRGVISSSLTFNLRAETKRVEDLPFFVNDHLNYIGNRFDVVYDTAQIIRFSGELAFHKGERFKLDLKGDYWEYRLENELHPWHKPKYKITFTGQYDIQDKFVINADLFYVGNRKARSLEPVEGVDPIYGAYPVDLKGYFDGNLGIEYRYTHKLSAFLQFNNLAAQRYQQWYQYRVQGFQVLGGVKYGF